MHTLSASCQGLGRPDVSYATVPKTPVLTIARKLHQGGCGRGGCRARAAGHKGFGSSAGSSSSQQKGAQQRAKIKDTGDANKATKTAINAVEANNKAPDVRPVDPLEAARGKLDIVEVANWGSGEHSALGDLQVKSYSPRLAVADASKPLYELIVHQLQLAEARGCLSVAGPAPPPLKDWSFAPNRYLQYLADLHHVHTALEASLQEVTGAAGEAATSPPTRALACMGPASGLHRAAAVADDTKAFLGSLSKDSMAAASTSEASAKPAASGGDGRWDSAPPPGPGAMAKSYAGYITRLAREAAAANNSQEEREAACCKLLAHSAVLHIVWQASGTRFGAVAVEKLELFRRQAASMYYSYPPEVSDPGKALMASLNAAGQALVGSSPTSSPAPSSSAAHADAGAGACASLPSRWRDYQQAVFDELPGAMQKASLALMAALAHTN